MEYCLKPDFEEVNQRFEAFWHREIFDRPPVSGIRFLIENPRRVPVKTYAHHRERWLDVSFRAEQIAIDLANYRYPAETLPVAWPNMGPEIFSAWYGCGYEFGETTAWTTPCVDDWEDDAKTAVFDPEHPLFTATMRFTKELLQFGQGNFLVGLTDFHPGGDHLAALRDPQRLALDLIDHPVFVQEKLKQSTEEYSHVYGLFYELLRDAGMPITSWTPLVYPGKYYIVSSDFSCMISPRMFEEFFLPGLIEECRFLDRSIYHLDGPGALKHLNCILGIPELDAVQWVPGAGHEGYAQWVAVYQRIQQVQKGIQLDIDIEELPMVFETLRPEGVWFSSIRGVADQQTLEIVLRRIAQWQ
ncbi:MAG: hypothetical protein M0Q40_09390 [Limnochordia bacterium]|nr:hypothetical protein [Limnochordia bacterium]